MGSSKARKDRRQQAQPTERADTSKASSSGQHDNGEGDSPHSSSDALVDFDRDVKCQQAGDKGRGLFWSPSNGGCLMRGTTIVQLEPEMMVPDGDSLKKRCHVCFGSDGHLQVCSGCKLVRYCSSACKATDLPIHQDECKALKTLQWDRIDDLPDSVLTNVRLAARLVWKRQKLGQTWWKRIDDLIPHPGTGTKKMVKDYNDACQLLLNYFGLSSVIPRRAKDATLAKLSFSSIEEVKKVYGRVINNAFPVTDSMLENVGMSLSSTAAIFNHSCDPNIVVVFPEGPGVKDCMHIVAIKDIKPGEELEVSYIDITLPRMHRQALLQELFTFQCNCTLCIAGKTENPNRTTNQVDLRHSVFCGWPKCCGFVALTDEGKPIGHCTECRRQCKVEDERLERFLKMGDQLVQNLRAGASIMDTGYNSRLLNEARLIAVGLNSIQPPCSWPLSSLMCYLRVMVKAQAEFHYMLGDRQEYFKYCMEGIRCGMIMMFGFQQMKLTRG